jgi:hypothetical protein
MSTWIRRFAKILGQVTFFFMMIIHFMRPDPLEYTSFIPALVVAFAAGSLIWFAGFIVGDIFFKGVLTDIKIERDNLIEGGMVQHIQMKQEQCVPGGKELPFSDSRVNVYRGKKNVH